MEETSVHTFFTCPFAQQVWRLSSFTEDLSQSMGDLIEKLRIILNHSTNKSLPREQRLLPIWIMWRLWKCRNDLIFNQKLFSAKEVVDKAQEDVREWIDLGPNMHTQSLQQQNAFPRMITSWRCPSQGWVKCNYDASHHVGHNVSGMGWIIRNHRDIYLVGGMGKFEGRSTVLESELTALIWSMQACWNYGYRNIVFEGDNITLTKILNQDSVSPRFQHLLATVQQWNYYFILLLLYMLSVRVTHVPISLLKNSYHFPIQIGVCFISVLVFCIPNKIFWLEKKRMVSL